MTVSSNPKYQVPAPAIYPVMSGSIHVPYVMGATYPITTITNTTASTISFADSYGKYELIVKDKIGNGEFQVEYNPNTTTLSVKYENSDELLEYALCRDDILNFIRTFAKCTQKNRNIYDELEGILTKKS